MMLGDLKTESLFALQPVFFIMLPLHAAEPVYLITFY